MTRLIKWLIGYVEFEFSGGFAQGFVSALYENGIRAFNICSDDGVVRGECRAGDYRRLHMLSRQHGGRVRLTGRHGIVFFWLRLRSRLGLVAGALAFVVIICTLSGYVWQVDIVGNEKIPVQQISEVLAKAGLERGCRWSRTDKDYIENMLLASFDDIAWAHINRQGSVARVEISEAISRPSLSDSTGIYNVKAITDGIIVSIRAAEGWEAVRAGDSVVKGDLLISGVHKTDEKTNSALAHARGEVIARVEQPFSLRVSREQRSRRSIREQEMKELYFFGIIIPLHFPVKKAIPHDISESSSYITLAGRELPLGVIHRRVSYYNMYSRALSDKELETLMQSEIKRSLAEQYGDAQIIRQDISVSLNADDAVADGRVISLRDIGEEVRLRRKKQNFVIE